MSKQHVRPGRTAKRERQNRVGRETGNQTFNPETNQWEHEQSENRTN